MTKTVAQDEWFADAGTRCRVLEADELDAVRKTILEEEGEHGWLWVVPADGHSFSFHDPVYAHESFFEEES